MKVDNRTGWNTLDIRRVLTACCREDDFRVPEGAIVRIVYCSLRCVQRWTLVSSWFSDLVCSEPFGIPSRDMIIPKRSDLPTPVPLKPRVLL